MLRNYLIALAVLLSLPMAVADGPYEQSDYGPPYGSCGVNLWSTQCRNLNVEVNCDISGASTHWVAEQCQPGEYCVEDDDGNGCQSWTFTCENNNDCPSQLPECGTNNRCQVQTNPPSQNPGDSNNPPPESQTPPPQTVQTNPYNCGLHGNYDETNYAKICYSGISVNPTRPTPLEDVIPRFVESSLNPQGYIIIAYNMDSNSKLSRRVSQLRAHLQAASSQGTDLPVLFEASSANTPHGEEDPRPDGEQSLVIVPYRGEAYTEGLPGDAYNEVADVIQSVGIEASAINQFLDDAYTQVSEFGDDLQADLDSYEERTGRGIRVYFTSADLPKEVDELIPIVLQSRQEQNRIINEPNLAVDDWLFYSLLGVCDVHILVTPEETKILYNEICPIIRPKSPVQDASSEEIAVFYIRGVMGLNEGPVDLRQVLARAAEYDRDRLNVNLAENRLEATKAFVNQRIRDDDNIPLEERRALQADLQILSIVGNLELAQEAEQRRQYYNQLLAQAPTAHPEFARYATRSVVEQAQREVTCAEAADVLEAFKPYLKLAEQSDLNDQIALCQRAAIEQTCRPIDGQQPGAIGSATIVFIQDADMEDDTFNRLVNVIDERVKRMPELSSYDDRISFWRAEAAQQIASTQGPLEPPVTNSQVVLHSMQACPGDVAIVLSDQNYLPWNHPRAGIPQGFISYDACGDSESCMALYTARSMARNLFGIEDYTDGTVTARLRLGDGESQIAMRFNEEQQEQIEDYFAAGWLN